MVEDNKESYYIACGKSISNSILYEVAVKECAEWQRWNDIDFRSMRRCVPWSTTELFFRSSKRMKNMVCKCIRYFLFFILSLSLEKKKRVPSFELLFTAAAAANISFSVFFFLFQEGFITTTIWKCLCHVSTSQIYFTWLISGDVRRSFLWSFFPTTIISRIVLSFMPMPMHVSST